MASYTPLVKQAHAFREISLDFTTPAEIFREAIANSLDAYARRIWLRTSVEERRGKEYVIIDLCDDGIGMSVNGVQAFLNLSDSVKAAAPPAGGVRRRMSGYKGHGTKIYYNSEHLEVLTYDGNGIAVYCHLADPRGELATGKVPVAEVEEISPVELRARREKWGFEELGEAPGTTIRVLGYHQNAKFGLEQALMPDLLPFAIRDYDSHFGFDGLATRNKELAINETSHLFVELKAELKKEFNHTFERLDAIICWSSRVKDGEAVSDLAGKKGTYHITSRPDGSKARYIVISDSPRNVEVIVFRELLLQRGVEFRPIGE
ncbi:ATP-binding protein [Bradyrhizobium tunisiense]|uniref:ATP-binding protein n=1 Tax=Bradyrhizobium tunisiense TaxID=3278709 RepID=UPI0035D5B104